MRGFARCIMGLVGMSILAGGCGGTDSSGLPPMTKDQAKNKADATTDYCQLYGWYSDGICDSFCLQPDPDCAADTCGKNEVSSFGRSDVQKMDDEFWATGLNVGDWAASLSRFVSQLWTPSSTKSYCNLSDAWKKTDFAQTHPQVVPAESSQIPIGWQMWMYPPSEWAGENANVSNIPGTVEMGEADCGFSPPPRGCGSNGALEVDVWSTEVVLLKVFNYEDFGSLTNGATMGLSALITFKNYDQESLGDGWFAIGMRPLSQAEDQGWDNPRHPDIWWLQVTPNSIKDNLSSVLYSGTQQQEKYGNASLGQVKAIEEDPDHTYCQDGCTTWHRLNLGTVFAPPATKDFAVYLKIGTPPNASAHTKVRVNDIKLQLNDSSLNQ